MFLTLTKLLQEAQKKKYHTIVAAIIHSWHKPQTCCLLNPHTLNLEVVVQRSEVTVMHMDSDAFTCTAKMLLVHSY